VYDDPAIERLYSVPAAKEYSRDMGSRALAKHRRNVKRNIFAVQVIQRVDMDMGKCILECMKGNRMD